MNIAALDDHIAKIYPDPEGKLVLRRPNGIAIRLRALDVDGTAQGIDYALELDEKAVAHGLHQAAVMVSYFGFEILMDISLQADARAFFVSADKAAVTGDVRDENGGEPAFHACLLPKGT
jgi:hypothetical protein